MRTATSTSVPRIYAQEPGLKLEELTERADLVADGKVRIEVKTGRNIDGAPEKQRLAGLRATAIQVAPLFNFGPTAPIRCYAFETDGNNPRNPRESADKKLPGSRA